MSASVKTLVNQPYKYGFVTDIEADTIPRGLSEDVVPPDFGQKERTRNSCSTSVYEPISNG